MRTRLANYPDPQIRQTYTSNEHQRLRCAANSSPSYNYTLVHNVRSWYYSTIQIQSPGEEAAITSRHRGVVKTTADITFTTYISIVLYTNEIIFKSTAYTRYIASTLMGKLDGVVPNIQIVQYNMSQHILCSILSKSTVYMVTVHNGVYREIRISTDTSIRSIQRTKMYRYICVTYTIYFLNRLHTNP